MWRKWVVCLVGILGLLVAIAYALLFIRFIPPRIVHTVNAITGKPVSGMDVCFQAVDNGWGTKFALSTKVTTTGSNGRAFFGPSILNLAMLQSVDAYSLQVTDPRSHRANSCGPQVGLTPDPIGSQPGDPFTHARTDGSEYFPVEIVEPKGLPQNASWYPFLRGASFRTNMTVNLVPVLEDPDQCEAISDSSLRQECTRLNKMAQEAMLQDLVPKYFSGMERVSVQMSKGHVPGSRTYYALYGNNGTPAHYIAVVIERFPNGQNASDYFDEVPRATPNCDLRDAVEDEAPTGERIYKMAFSQSPCAFWATDNQLTILRFLPPLPYQSPLVNSWRMLRHPFTR